MNTINLMKPATERARLAALQELGILDSNTSDYIDSVTSLAATFFNTSGAYLSLIDRDRQWLKSQAGACPTGGARDQSFCTYTIMGAAVMVVEDALLDPRFQDNAMVAGEPRIRFYAGAPLLTKDGHAIGALCIVDTQPRMLDAAQRGQLQNMAALIMSHIELRRAVGHVDAVTGMPNRTQLAEDLAALAQRGDIRGQRRVLAYIDMPDAAAAFEIASVLGVAVYDQLIRGVAQKLRLLFASRADVYHLADARFALVSRDHEVAAFTAFIHAAEPALQEPVRNLNVPLQLPSFGGIVTFENGIDAVGDVLRMALSAVNQAVLTQQRWNSYDMHYDFSHQRSFKLLNAIDEAIRTDAFELVYQPKHDLTTQQCVSAEALIRWTHPELGAIAPSEFIALVEKTALIRPLSNWVIATAIRQAGVWHAAGRKIKLAINLSARNFEEADLCERLAAACSLNGVDPRYIEIECTEGVWMDSAAILQTLHAIRALGMGLALDDFGTGYSNFSYLQKIPATVLKLDQSLIRNIAGNPRDQRIVRALIGLAQELDYRVVAEGVETREILEMITAWGCDEAQGYLLARPLTAGAFEAHVAMAGGALREKLAA